MKQKKIMKNYSDITMVRHPQIIEMRYYMY